jgi:hypothetical protein
LVLVVGVLALKILALAFVGDVGFDCLGPRVILVPGAVFVGLFLFFYFVPCRMQQKVENGLNKKEEDPVKIKQERDPSKGGLQGKNLELTLSSSSIMTQFWFNFHSVLIEF